MNDLEIFRTEIDEVDKKLIECLWDRFKLIKKVWIYKKKNNIKPLQLKRWQEVLESRKIYAKNLWMDENMIEDFWNLIHKYSLDLEKLEK